MTTAAVFFGVAFFKAYVAYNTQYSTMMYNGKKALKLTLGDSYLNALMAADTKHILNANAYLLFPSIFYDGTIDLDLALMRNKNSYDFTAFGQTSPVAGFGGIVFHAADTNDNELITILSLKRILIGILRSYF